MQKFLIMLLLSAAAYAQGGLFNDIALNSSGRPAPGATVLACSSTATGTPCTPTVTVYSDAALTTSTSVIADANGNFRFYAVPGFYRLQVTYLASTYTYTVNIPAPMPTGRIDVSAQPGSTLGAKIIACIAALPSTGGVCDASGISGAQTITANIWAGNTKPVKLVLGNATITDSSCWVMPNDGASPPAQPSIVIIGVGIDAATIAAGKTPTSGTIINNSCSTGVAKIDTRGAGVMEISGVTFTDSSGGTLPFIQTTNTILLLHDNQFFGSKNGVLCDQDAIVLGSTTTNIDGSSTAAFQGYGTAIKNNFFNHIRRAVYGRTFTNAVNVKDNTIWEESGSNLSGGAAIEFDDVSNTQSVTGNTIESNLIEVTNYPYGIKLTTNGIANAIKFNSCFDPSVTHIQCVRTEASSQFNTIENAYYNDSYGGLSEATANSNNFLTSHQGQFSNSTQPIKFTSPVGVGSPSAAYRFEKTTVNTPFVNFRLTTNNDEYYFGAATATASNFNLWMYPAGGTVEQLVQFRRYDANQRGIYINASTNAFFEGAADVRVRAAGGSTLWLGTNTKGDGILVGDASVTVKNALTAQSSVLSSSASAGIGYTTGAGCAITQGTSKSTAVTCAGVSGAVTMNGAALAGSTSVGFTVTDTSVAVTDVVHVSIKSGATADSYVVTVDATGAGSFRISLRNVSAGSLSEAVIINFAVIKGVSS